MYNVKSWLRNPNRSYQDGLDIYNKYKASTKYDKFLGVDSPSSVQVNMLFSKITRIHSKLISQPSLIIEEPDEPIKIKKIIAKNTTIPKKDTTTTSDRKTNKKYINKLLTLNFSDLNFDDKLIFNNNEKYFLEKKTAFISVSDNMRELRSLHAKIKTLDPNPKYNSKRSKIIKDIAFLDDSIAALYKVIDSWKEPTLTDTTKSKTDLAVSKALADQKRIAANNIFIKRALKTIPLMPENTLKQKAKKNKKIADLKSRKKELVDLGAPYKS